MSYQIVENDVRLLRRVLVARQLEDGASAVKIVKHLRGKGLRFVLPGEQSESERVGYAGRLPDNEKWLVEQYGCILLPEYHDIIFLNSKWMNPYTLYVRLVEPVPELGDVGQKYWIPRQLGLEEQYRAGAEKAHAKYVLGNPPAPVRGLIAGIRKILGE
jgi:hypothetical protein